MSIEERVERLERQMDWYRWVIGILLGVICVAVILEVDHRAEKDLADSKVPIHEVLRARRIEIVDSAGREHIGISVLEQRSALDSTTIKMTSGIWIWNPIDTTMRMHMFVTEDHANISMYPPMSEGRVRGGTVFIRGGRDGAKLSLEGGAGSVGALLSLEGGVGGAALRVGDGIRMSEDKESGMVKLTLGQPNYLQTVAAGENGGGVLEIMSGDGWPGVVFDTDDFGGRAILLNKTSEVIANITADDYGYGRIGVWDRKGKGRTLTPR
jgi:hypothetical protein